VSALCRQQLAAVAVAVVTHPTAMAPVLMADQVVAVPQVLAARLAFLAKEIMALVVPQQVDAVAAAVREPVLARLVAATAVPVEPERPPPLRALL
tara:strand:- start:959 stop:1243 length:285 start_codon:yes stop_codon:yes gene_type:complete